MFTNYTDLRGQGLVVKLGDKADLLSALTQAAARRTADKQRVQFMDNIPSSQTKTIAKVSNPERKWVDSRNTIGLMQGTGKKWINLEQSNLAKLGTGSTFYHARKSNHHSSLDPSSRQVCPNSGATSIMAPYGDMFTDYTDLRGQGLVVKLGDEAKIIPIAGRGTLAISMHGHTIAYANTLHVPDLSIILLSSRVHR
jgi:hypothetical protein